jgi:hypothetical protein
LPLRLGWCRSGSGAGCGSASPPESDLIVTLFITLLLESAIVLAYAFWRKKPVHPILATSICGNLITQFMLWIALNLFFQNYLATLFISEILIWIAESLLLYFIPANYLSIKEASLLSLAINLSSFTLGWFLPV